VAGVRLVAALGLALLVTTVVGVWRSDAATMPELARPARGRESVPLCSPECEVIVAPTEAGSGFEYEGAGPGGGFTPAELREAYGLPDHGGAGVTVAIVDDVGDPEAEDGLAIYRERFGLPGCTEGNGCFRQVDEHGLPSPRDEWSSWASEISLDLDMVSAACPECNILLVEGAGRAGRVEAIKTAVEMGAAVVTNSWNFGFEKGNPADGAGCSITACVTAAEEEEWDPKLSFPGVPILFSGGDYGYAVRYPAVSPNVISVGGTSLFHEPEGDREWSEEVWSNPGYDEDESGRGTGSGCSRYEPKPTWETDDACPARIENDVAADADPRTPVAVYSDWWEEWRLVGGTSASTPFVAGVEAISSARARELGAAAFWQAGEAGSFFDVTAGNDGSCTPPAADAYWCTAGTGYDAPTGWGTPDGPLLLTGPPVVHTDAADSISTTGATLHGRVDDTGVAGGTECSFQVAAASDPAFASPLRTVPCEPNPVEGSSAVAVSVTLSGLSPHTNYLFRVAGTNAEGGPVNGQARAFETSTEPPEATLESADQLTQTTAELRGFVDNHGAPRGTTCHFEVAHGDDITFQSPFETVPCDPPLVEGEGQTSVAATLTGLSVNASYLYRLVVSSAGGDPPPSPYLMAETLPEAPTVSTGGAGAVGTATAVLHGRVDDEGDLAGSACQFEVAAAGDLEFDSPLTTIPCDPSPVDGEEEVAVSAEVSGLAPATEYRYRVAASNRGGETFGSGRSFTTEALTESPPVRETGPTTPVIVNLPPDEKEIREQHEAEERAQHEAEAHEQQEAEARRASDAASVPTGEGSPPSNRFTLGRVRRRGAVLTVALTLPGAGTIGRSVPGHSRCGSP
jgi:hypothetical protein